MTGSQELILSKVKKLISLAGNNPSQQEAEAAMMKAQSLLSEHGLTMTQVEAAAGVKQEVTEIPADDTGARRSPWWHKRIARLIAGNYRCAYYIQLLRSGYRYDTRSHAMFVGLPVDAEVAKEMFLLAINTADKEAKKFLRVEKRIAGPSWCRSMSTATRNDYLDGWIKGLTESFRKNVESNALVVVKPQEVEDAMSRKKLFVIGASEIKSSGSARAKSAGKIDGSLFGKHREIGP